MVRGDVASVDTGEKVAVAGAYRGALRMVGRTEERTSDMGKFVDSEGVEDCEAGETEGRSATERRAAKSPVPSSIMSLLCSGCANALNGAHTTMSKTSASQL